jgi:hypothetical protein
VKKERYEKPGSEAYLLFMEGCIAGSPGDGGNEGFEDPDHDLLNIPSSIWNGPLVL